MDHRNGNEPLGMLYTCLLDWVPAVESSGSASLFCKRRYHTPTTSLAFFKSLEKDEDETRRSIGVSLDAKQSIEAHLTTIRLLPKPCTRNRIFHLTNSLRQRPPARRHVWSRLARVDAASTGYSKFTANASRATRNGVHDAESACNGRPQSTRGTPRDQTLTSPQIQKSSGCPKGRMMAAQQW